MNEILFDLTKPHCLACGKEMKHNVPRLGDAGGWIHSDTGFPLCGQRPPIDIVFLEDPHVLRVGHIGVTYQTPRMAIPSHDKAHT